MHYLDLRSEKIAAVLCLGVLCPCAVGESTDKEARGSLLAISRQLIVSKTSKLVVSSGILSPKQEWA